MNFKKSIFEASKGGKLTVKRGTALLLSVLLFLCSLWLTGCLQKQQSFEHRCIFCIECKTILNNSDKFDREKLEIIPENGIILEKCEAGFNEGETVFDVFSRETRARRIHTEISRNPDLSVYIEGVNNIYEFDCGAGSGWLYSVNGAFQSVSCSRYRLGEGDEILFVYTCDGGADVGNAAPKGN